MSFSGSKGSPKVDPPKPVTPTEPTAPQPPPEKDPVRKLPAYYVFLRKFMGLKETDKKLSDFLVPYWKKAGLNLKTIAGSGAAWCGLFIFAGLLNVDYKALDSAFRAKSFDNFGVAVNWKSDGISEGTIIRVNNKGNCSSISDNHVTMAAGDCTPQDLNKPGATIAAYGGNQGDRAKISVYAVKNICAVRWAPESGPIPKVTKSFNCTTGSATNESTR